MSSFSVIAFPCADRAGLFAGLIRWSESNKKREANATPNAAEFSQNFYLATFLPLSLSPLHRMRIVGATGPRLDLSPDLPLPYQHTPGSQWNCSQTIPCNSRPCTRSLTTKGVHLRHNTNFSQRSPKWRLRALPTPLRRHLGAPPPPVFLPGFCLVFALSTRWTRSERTKFFVRRHQSSTLNPNPHLSQWKRRPAKG